MKMPIFKTINENFFKAWSSDMAYVLGFFAADGSMYETRRGTHFIEFQITDKELLYSIRAAIGSDHKITERKGRKTTHKELYRLQIGNKVIFRDLSVLGFTQAKSKTMTLPIIPRAYFGDFVRGYFDGDGHIFIGKYFRADRSKLKRVILSGFTSGSGLFLEQVYKQLKARGIKGGTLHYSSGGYRLAFSGADSRTLYGIMYSGENKRLFLGRKRERFEKTFSMA